jgi:hypothetical protein
MAGGQQARRIWVPSVDRADDVDDVGGRQVAPGRCHRAPHRQSVGVANAADPAALRQDPWPAPPVNGAVHPAAPEQAAVGGIDDHIDLLGRDVALHQRDPCRHPALRWPSVRRIRSATPAGSLTIWS